MHSENERRPKQIIPTHGPPPPARAPEQTIPDDGPPVDMPPPSRPSRPPEHAPSQRAGGRVQVKRRETPPEGTPIVIDRQRGGARAIAGICSAAFSSTTIVG